MYLTVPGTSVLEKREDLGIDFSNDANGNVY